MRGQILVFNEQKVAGAIVTDDGRRFLFHINEWEDVVPPDRGMAVSFMLDADNRARQVQLALPDAIPTAAATPRTPTPPSAPPLALRPKRKPVITLLAFVSRSKTKLSAWRVAAAVNPAFNLLANCQGRLLHQFASIA